MPDFPPDPTLHLTEELIACPSVTPDDGGCMELIAARLQSIGFGCEFIDRGGVRNLWARRGSQRPLICFAGHTDVVPPGPPTDWQSPPFAPTRRDGLLFGRGAADMKASVAAFVTAIEDFVRVRPQHAGSIALLLTSDEEGAAIDGTVAVTEALHTRGEAMDFCVVGEPSSVSVLGDTIKTGRRGSLTGALTIKGIQGHVAYPDRARNPIHLAAPAIAELAGTVWDSGNAAFPPTTWQISNIHGGTGAGNVIPGHLDVLFNFRFGTASTPECLKERVAAILDRHGLDYHLAWTLGAQPFLTGGGDLINATIEAIRAETGLMPALSTTGGTSDGRFIAAICPQVIEFGPLNASIHKIDEHVAIADLPRLSAVYRRILEQLLPDAA